MLSPHALTTIESLKDAMGPLEEEDVPSESALIRSINAASDAIRHYCRRDFARAELTERVAGRDSSRLMLSLVPVVEVDSIHLHGSEVDVGSITVEHRSGILYRNGVWPQSNEPNVAVTYTGGYVTPAQATDDLERDLPYDIEEACLIIASTRLQSMGQPVDAQMMQVEQIRVQFGEGGRQSIPQQAAMLLEPYVRWV